MMIDSHCHLDLLDFEKLGLSMDEVVSNAMEVGVTKIVNVSIDLASAPTVIATAEKFPNVFASVGVHPSEKLAQEPDESCYLQLAAHPKVVAIGETGLDYHYNDSGYDVMQQRFRTQIRVANQLKKPIIVHSRAAREDTITIMREEDVTCCGGVMHCFTESLQMAKQALDLGMYISFSGIVTFKNAHELVEVASYVPLDRILIETDAPYLTPVPLRGKPNQPANVRFVAEKIADIKQLSLEQVCLQTSENTNQLFHFS